MSVLAPELGNHDLDVSGPVGEQARLSIAWHNTTANRPDAEAIIGRPVGTEPMCFLSAVIYTVDIRY